MFEIFTEGITLLNSISFLAFFTTVGLFFCGLPICRQIWKRQDTKEISGAPFMMGVIGGSCWWAYGYLKSDQTVLCVTSTQILLYSSYLTFYWIMSKNKLKCTLKVATPVVVCTLLYVSVYFLGQKVYHPLGIICICLNVADFAAPLAGIKYVIRRHSTQTLPMPLCIANFLVSSEWCIYGLLKQDFYLILPNGIGSVLAAGQLILFLVLPRKTGLRSPLAKLISCIAPCCSDDTTNDVEADVAKVMPEGNEDAPTKCSWSERVIANVTEEIGNVLQKCTIKDQFAYLDTLNKPCDGNFDSTTVSTIEEIMKEVSEAKSKDVPHLFQKEEKLENLRRQLSSKLEGNVPLAVPVTGFKSEVLVVNHLKQPKRTVSAPNLSL